jgi:hypothetical protein
MVPMIQSDQVHGVYILQYPSLCTYIGGHHQADEFTEENYEQELGRGYFCFFVYYTILLT